MSIICPFCSQENQSTATMCITCGAPLIPQSPTYHLPAGSLLLQGKYRVEKIIGEGGFGITYGGVDLVNSRNVAIKENWPEKASRQGTTVVWPHTTTPKSRDEQLKKVATEAECLSKCIHPNIVRVYDSFQENNTAYVVMDFIAGKPLSTIIEEEGTLPKERVKRYLIQLAEALRVIHGANLLHRDIKPDNIIIDRQDRAILIDFGATKEFIAGQTRQMSVTLTRGYAPLEQYSYKSKRYPATDIYALCASMYEVLTGELPPEATERIHTDTLVSPRQLLPGLDPLIEQVILTGMRMKVEERFQTADELLQVLTEGIATTTGSPAYHLSAGTLLKQGRYRIEKTLGEGGFGITYKATELTSTVNVAIKELWPEQSRRQGTSITWPNSITLQERKQQLSKFQLEAHYLSRCVHPNIVKVYDWFEENNTAYIVMEFIAGKSLYQILRDEKPLSEERVKRYVIKIAEGLKVVHSNNLLHRGIKPDDILIDPRDDRAVLIDFGASREFTPGISSDMDTIFTPGYAPLEQYARKIKRYPATDIYALCASMYEVLTGELPSEVTERIQVETLIPPRQLRPDLSPLIEQVILTGMRMKVEERFQTADQFIQALKGSGGSGATAKLIYVQSLNHIREFVLDKSRLIIGRIDVGSEAVNINLAGFSGDETVSAQHAGIYQEAGRWNIIDLDSTNGTFIKRNGEKRFGPKITAPETLNSGDEIAFGKVRFRFQDT